MAASNIFRLAFALQSGKGAVASVPQWLVDVADSDIAPKTDIEEREETGTGRDTGDSYIKLISAGGSAKITARAKTAALLAYAALGSRATVGTGSPAAAPWTHSATAADDQPWLTVWRQLVNGVIERFADCKITKLKYEWKAGGDLMQDIEVMGLRPDRLSAMPAGGTYDNGLPLRVPGMAYTIEGAANDAITGGEVEIEAEQEALQTTKIYASYLEPKKREIKASYDEIYQNVERYAKVLYGSAAGLSPTETIYEGAVKFDFGNVVAGPGLSLEIPRFQFTEVKAEPNTNGEALMIPVAGKAARPPGGASIVTAKIVNDVASYAAAV